MSRRREFYFGEGYPIIYARSTVEAWGKLNKWAAKNLPADHAPIPDEPVRQSDLLLADKEQEAE